MTTSWESQLFVYAKAKAQISSVVTIQLFPTITAIEVRFHYFLNPKFQALRHPQWLYSPICVGPDWKFRRQIFSWHSSYLFLIGQVGKELFCVKKSILVTFSVLIISLCEVHTSVFIAVFLPNWMLNMSRYTKMFIKSLHSVVAPFIFFNLVYETRDNLGELWFYSCQKLIKT